MKLKNTNEILKEFSKGPNLGSFVFADTSGIIDIVKVCRKEFSDPIDFLDRILKKNKLRFLLTNKTHGECRIQSRVKKNRHVFILPENVLGYFEDCGKNVSHGIDFVSNEDSEQIRYDVHWASKIACNGVEKKRDEVFGEVDKDILYRASFLSTGKVKTPNEEMRDVGSVGILSSDGHLIEGAKFMNNIKDDFGINKYSLYTINTKKN
ncbi:MAG: hypothetical protein ABIA78_02755 [archaeon]